MIDMVNEVVDVRGAFAYQYVRFERVVVETRRQWLYRVVLISVNVDESILEASITEVLIPPFLLAQKIELREF